MARQPLPVFVGLGGINGAGRVSGYHALRRMAWEALSSDERAGTRAALGQLMGLEGDAAEESRVLAHTLVRRVEAAHFNPDAVPWNQRLVTQAGDPPLTFRLRRNHLPQRVPDHWEVTELENGEFQVRTGEAQDWLLPVAREFEVKAAGQLPSGFDPGTLYPSRNHPRGLQMMIYAASDALGDLGISWDALQRHVSADQVSVYAGSAMGQLDSAGGGGMLKARYNGQRVTSKFCPLSLAEMPADFVNAYVLGSMGSTGASLGACASFLYNLRLGIDDIRSGRSRVVFVGAAEAPVVPEVMEGYAAMGALATDKGLRELDGLSADQEPDHRRACRPFAENCGFTIAESAQMVVLFDDALAMEMGASILGAAADVFVNADGYKKSISGPGVGNYITMAKALAALRGVLGEEGLRTGGLVQAHGTGTPQNRVTESRILSSVAEAFGLEDWPVAALKCYLGHSLGAASGDQVTATLSSWATGLLPGIATIDRLADDVVSERLDFALGHRRVDPSAQRYAVVNSKGFGGNNASAALISPAVTQRMLQARYGAREWQAWQARNEQVEAARRDYDEAVTAGRVKPVYRFDHGVLGDDDVALSASALRVGDFDIPLDLPNPWGDMTPGD